MGVLGTSRRLELIRLTYYCRPAKLLDTKLSLGPKEKKDVLLGVLPLICSGYCGAIGWKKSGYDVMCNPSDTLKAQRLVSVMVYPLCRLTSSTSTWLMGRVALLDSFCTRLPGTAEIAMLCRYPVWTL